ncbi:hypothetical protein ACFSJQ_06950 [Vibrio olivae]|uniref:Uncharacterized protein n=1 Tax=Vibrio olivae TaxID=1243002 RepID=A0ABV5HK06_9VIBR
MSYKLSMLLSLLIASPASWACSYDGQFSNPFAESYPGALDVAIATQQAVKNDVIMPTKVLTGTNGLRRVTWWLKVWGDSSPPIPSNSYIYLVDSQLWAQYKQGKAIAVHVAPPKGGVTVVQLTETTLHSLISETLTFEHALDIGLILRT